MEARLNELASLQSGWYDGIQGDTIDPEAIRITGDLMSLIPDTTRACIAPSVDGGISITLKDIAMHISDDIVVLRSNHPPAGFGIDPQSLQEIANLIKSL